MWKIVFGRIGLFVFYPWLPKAQVFQKETSWNTGFPSANGSLATFKDEAASLIDAIFSTWHVFRHTHCSWLEVCSPRRSKRMDSYVFYEFVVIYKNLYCIHVQVASTVDNSVRGWISLVLQKSWQNLERESTECSAKVRLVHGERICS